MINTIKITKEIFEECKIPEPKISITQTFENGNESYEDENYIGWNGMCVKKFQILEVQNEEILESKSN